MITKESLIEARETVNETVLRIKQQYSTKEAKRILVVVEGKDDITYYILKTSNYQDQGFKFRVLSAGNRAQVIYAYDHIDWEIYSKSRILFIVDRDLSDYTAERTPEDENIYVTDKYSIENELCTLCTFLNTLKCYCGLSEMDDRDENELEEYYAKLSQEFYKIVDPIMGLILCWKTNGIKANYSNINCNSIIEINKDGLSITDKLKGEKELIKYACKQSQVEYDDSIDLESYVAQLKKRYSPEYYTRGKYLLSFFVRIINYVANNSGSLLSSKKKGKMTISIGQGDAVAKMCALMQTPQTLKDFFAERLKKLSEEYKDECLSEA